MADEAGGLSGAAAGGEQVPAAGQPGQKTQKGGPDSGERSSDSGRHAPGGEERKIRPIPPGRSNAGERGRDGRERPAMPSDLGFARNEPDAEISEFLEPGGQKRDPFTGRFIPSIADELEADEKAAREAASAEDADQPGVRKSAAEKPPVVKAGEQKPAEVKPPLPQTNEQKVLYRGKEVTIPELEQKHKSLEGQFKSLSEERDYGYRAGFAWKEVAERNAARIAQLEQALQSGSGGRAGSAAGAGATAGAAETKADPLNRDTLLSKLDFNRFEQAALKDGLPGAGKQLASDVLDVVLNELVPALRAEQEANLAPFNDEREAAAVTEATEQQILQLASYQNADGSLAFPELADPDKLHEIARSWVDSGGDPADAMSVSGMIRALGNYRLLQGFIANPASVVAVPNPTPGNGAAGNLPAAVPRPALAASVPADQGGTAPANAGRSNLDPASQRFVNALSKVDLVDPKLGFAKNRPNSHVGYRE